uniref:Uncharacterized protein n=1 Tax=Rhodosorus marinus TaxID=101924 RepID=A0A7S3ABL8_9RHOD
MPRQSMSGRLENTSTENRSPHLAATLLDKRLVGALLRTSKLVALDKDLIVAALILSFRSVSSFLAALRSLPKSNTFKPDLCRGVLALLPLLLNQDRRSYRVSPVAIAAEGIRFDCSCDFGIGYRQS